MPLILVLLALCPLLAAADGDLPLPDGVVSPWDLDDAARTETATRARVCLNGLWRCQPVDAAGAAAPPPAGSGWGWGKVPGVWPVAKGLRTWKFAGDAQELLLPPAVAARSVAESFERVWYQRVFTVPTAWAGHRLELDLAMVNTAARVLLDGVEAGRVGWPGGRIDLGPAAPGEHVLAMLIDASGTRETVDSGLYTGSRKHQAARFRGPTGDVHLEVVPFARIVSVRAEPSVREDRLSLAVAVAGAPDGARIAARILGPDGRELIALGPAAVEGGRVRLSASATALPRWDVETPENRCRALVVLSGPDGGVLDQALPVEFGFRELWAEGRDLMLNGIRFHGRAIAVSNHLMPADRAGPAAVERTLRLAKAWGFNAVNLSGEYEPGEWTDVEPVLAAADRVGVVVAMTTPHPKLLDWNRGDAALAEWTRSADALIGRIHHHPSVAMYSLSFNWGWYYGHEDPRLMDGTYEPEAAAENVANGHRAVMARTEAAIRALDPTRFAYHHHSGNFGPAHTDCIYLNWAPVQERSEWPLQWSGHGVKPLMFVEWGLPHFASWSNYRGPEHLHNHFGPQWLWTAEFNAPFLGQEAYRPAPNRDQILRRTDELLTAGKPFHNAALVTAGFLYREELPVQAAYAAENWRAHRALGLSWTLPWDQEGYARPRADAPLDPRPEPERWRGLKRPGLVADVAVRKLAMGAEVFNHPEPERWEPTVLGREVLRWNRPLVAWIAGGPGAEAVAAQHRTWLAGETATYQLVIVNDRRTARTVAWRWRLDGTGLAASGEAQVPAGGQARIPVALALPSGLPPGELGLSAAFTAPGEEPQEDVRRLRIIAPAPALAIAPVALWDPRGDSAPALRRAGVPFTTVADPSAAGEAQVLVIGRGAVDPRTGLPFLDQRAVRGRHVLVLEQGEAALRERFGFHTTVHGERRLQVRVPGHPAMAGLDDGLFADWRGSATLVPPFREAAPPPAAYDLREDWNGFANAHVQRCGNRGTVASVLIEKPCRGDALALVDGGFDLQYTALLELRRGPGRIVFCQLDVSGRDADEPAAALVLQGIVRHLATAAPSAAPRQAMAAGAAAVDLCAALGISAVSAAGRQPGPGDLLVISPGHGLGDIRAAIGRGAHALILGCGGAELAATLGDAIAWADGPTRSAFRERWDEPILAGCSNADLYLRRPLPGGLSAGDGQRDTVRIIRLGEGIAAVCQIAPWEYADPARPDLRTTQRHAWLLASRLLDNLGAAADAGLVARAADGRSGRMPLADGWRGRLDPGERFRGGDWTAPAFDDAAWPAIRVGEAYNGQLPGSADHLGMVWYRLRLRVPADFAADRPTILRLGPVDDVCTVWLDGVRIGEVSKATNPKDHWSVVKDWPVPAGMLRPGAESVLVVQVENTFRTGGIMAVPELRVRRPEPYIQELKADDDPYRYFNW